METVAKRTATGWEYHYRFVNRESLETRFLIFIVVAGRAEFVTPLLTDTARQPQIPYPRGSIFITVKPQEIRSFVVVDTAPPIEITGHLRILDRHNSIYGGAGVSLYVPRWDRLFK